MEDEFGETPKIYVWPADAEPGWEYPDDFWERLTKGLKYVGISWESS